MDKSTQRAAARAAARADAEETAQVCRFFDSKEEHVRTLRRIHSRTTYQDPDFGDWHTEEWTRKLEAYIAEKMVATGAVVESAALLSKVGADLSSRWHAPGYFDAEVRVPATTGREYEQECRDVLEREGWHCRLTPASGDQGVDIIATKGECRVAVQCKLHSRPVGNKAVQEVEAGRVFYDCTHAVVATDAGWTNAALKLAQKIGVELRSTQQLRDLE